MYIRKESWGKWRKRPIEILNYNLEGQRSINVIFLCYSKLICFIFYSEYFPICAAFTGNVTTTA